MTRFLLPKRSGIHRVACFALYRALLSQCPHLPIPTDQQRGVINTIKKFFRRNSRFGSHKVIASALTAGYEAEQLLRASASGDSASTSRILTLVSAIAPAKTPKPVKPPKTSHSPPSPKCRYSGPFPGATSVLSRPHLIVSGRRHVPKLVNAGSFPMLRFKKPQSLFLSRVLREKIRQKAKRWGAVNKLEEEGLAMAEMEDDWEGFLSDQWSNEAEMGGNVHAENVANRIDAEDPQFKQSMSETIESLYSDIEKQDINNRELATKMQQIVDQEQELVDEEKRNRRQKARDRRVNRRRLRREGENIEVVEAL
ncbi:MAG: hypothetical protein M1837_004362 [Sclerophora amabilis]|nr:MAG: hypothetical protein M1837_004362 [Sclerophora amabilis]